MNPLCLKEHMIAREHCMEWLEVDDMVMFAPAFAKLSYWYPRGPDGQPSLTHPTLGSSVSKPLLHGLVISLLPTEYSNVQIST
jgi:hypothetical protein